MRLVRQRRGWTARDLAARCASLGAPQITHTVITNLETGRPGPDGRRRRDVTVDELLIFAAALDVPPLYLLTPLTGDCVIAVTQSLLMDGLEASRWLAGEQMPAVLGEDGRAQITFRRSQRPLHVLQEVWMFSEAVTRLREDGRAGTGDYQVGLAALARAVAELDGLEIPYPPLPHWLTDDLARHAGTEPERLPDGAH